MPKPTLPIVHSNGTGARDLTRDYLNASRAVSAAIDAVHQIEFNARDYYPTPGLWELARDERQAQLEALHEIQADFDKIAEHCSQYVKP